MYVVYRPDRLNTLSNVSRYTVNPLAAYLKNTFPEIEEAIPLSPSYPESKITVDDVEYPASIISVDTSFFRMFDVKVLEGSRDFLINNSKNIAITREKARQLFGNEHPIGKTVKIWRDEFTICAVVSDMPKRSNYAFDFIQPFRFHPAIILLSNWFQV